MTEIDLAPLAPDAVRIEVEGCGVCGSNLPVWEGRPWFDYPLPPGAPGHEAWGVVAETGSSVTASVCRVGDRVAFVADRAFVDTVDVAASALVVLPPALEGQPFPGEAIGCGVNVAARARFAPGDVVAVIGIGFLGAVVTALAAGAGAHVIAISRRSFSLDVARRMGAKDVVELGEPGDAPGVAERVAERVAELTNGASCDIVVEAVGTQEPLALAGRLVRESGRLVIAGFHQDGDRTLDIGMWNWKGIDVVNAHFRDPDVVLSGMRGAVSAVVDGVIDLGALCTHPFPLDRLGDAMDAMAERPDGFLKAYTTR